MTRQAQPGQPPLQRAADGTETHQPGGAPGEFGAPEPLIGDGAVAKHLPGPDVGVGGQQVTGGREQQGDRHLGDRVGVAARRVQHRDAGARRARDVDVVRVAAGRGDGPQSEFEHRTTYRITLHDNNIGCMRADLLGQLLGAVDPQRGLLDPRVVDHVDELSQLVEGRRPATGQSRGHEVRSRLLMLAYGGARVTRSGHNRHRHRHHRGQGGGRRRRRSGGGQDTNSAPVADTGAGPPGA